MVGVLRCGMVLVVGGVLGCASDDGGAPADADSGGQDSGEVEVGPTVTAHPDSLFVIAGERLQQGAEQGLFVNDEVPPGRPLWLARFDEQTERGATVDVDDAGAVSVATAEDGWGTDRFSYSVMGSVGAESSAEVTVYVAPVRGELRAEEIDPRGFSLFMYPGGSQDLRWRASPAGDFDGDGVSDLVIADAKFREDGEHRCRAYLIFGGAVADSSHLNDLEAGTQTLFLDGPANLACSRARPIGDFNGDGLDDIVVAVQGDSGRSTLFVVHGRREREPNLRMLLSSPSPGVIPISFSGSLHDFEGLGDFDHDGYDDLGIVGDATRIVFGRPERAAIDLDAFEPPSGVTVVPGSFEVVDLGAAGDFNGDDIDDVFLVSGGTVSLVFGSGGVRSVTEADWSFAHEGAAGPSYGASYSSAIGDIDGDGRDDLVMPSPQRTSAAVVLGRSGGPSTRLEELLEGEGAFAVAFPFPHTSFAARSGGDINGDGFGDVLLSSWDTNSTCRGHVVYGKPGAENVPIQHLEDGLHGYGVSSSLAPLLPWFDSARGLGDFNGDGFDDWMMGPYAYGDRFDIIFGVPTHDTCCSPHARPGCTHAGVQACVCDGDQDCCTEGWIPACVQRAAACGACE